MHSKSTLAAACACSLIVALLGAATLRAETTPEPPTTTTETETATVPTFTQQERQRMIDAYRHQVWRWQRVMGSHHVLRRLPNPPTELPSKIAAWKRIATTVREHALNPPHKRQWLCIHRFEGAWNGEFKTSLNKLVAALQEAANEIGTHHGNIDAATR